MPQENTTCEILALERSRLIVLPSGQKYARYGESHDQRLGHSNTGEQNRNTV